MENASRALIIAGSVLISIMILAVGIYLYQQGNDFAASTSERTTNSTLQNFNSKFEIYETEGDYGDEIDSDSERNSASTTLNTISDVISAVNKAVSLNSVNNYAYSYASSMGVETQNAVEIYIDLSGQSVTANNGSSYNFLLVEPNQYISTGYVYGITSPGTTRTDRLKNFNSLVTSTDEASKYAVSTNDLLSVFNVTKYDTTTNSTFYKYYFYATCEYDEDLGQVNSVIFKLIVDTSF